MVINVSANVADFLSGVANLPSLYMQIFTVAFFMVIIVVYSIFVWKVYKAIARKDVISLNLQQYNIFEHPTSEKIYAAVLYLLEYIVIVPFLIAFWFVVFALVLLFFSENLVLEHILLLSAAVVGSIRMLAYYKHELAADVAKVLPLAILGIMLLSPSFLEIGVLFESVNQVPALLLSIGYILGFVVGLEIILRVLDLFKRIIMGSN